MTTDKDNLVYRENLLGKGREETVGVSSYGFQDPTGEFPKKQYHYDIGINKAGRGLKINELYVGGGDIGVDLGIEPQQPSRHPFNDVNETSSGHVVEYDNTPGGERILIRHRTGAGVEMRADGSVIASSVGNKVEVVGGKSTVIIEGDGRIIYKGNLNLQVAGDFNIDVGGNYNLRVAGEKIETVEGSHRTFINNNKEEITKGNKSTKTLGNVIETYLSDQKTFVKNNQTNWVGNSLDLNVDKKTFISSKDEYVVSSNKVSITGDNLAVLGSKGSIGGENIDFTGKVYQGPKGPVPFTSGASFYGSFLGQSIESSFSDKAGQAMKAMTAGSLGASGVGYPVPKNRETKQPSSPTPVSSLIGSILSSGSYSVRSVSIDAGDVLKNKILLRDNYNGLYEKIPTIQEIRSTIREPSNKSSIAGILVAEGRLNPEYGSRRPKKIGRTSGKKPKPRFGYTPIGNSIDNRGKRFTPKS